MFRIQIVIGVPLFSFYFVVLFAYVDSESLLICGLSVCGENPSNHSLEPRLLSDWDAVADLVAVLPRPPRLICLPWQRHDFWFLCMFVTFGGLTLCQFMGLQYPYWHIFRVVTPPFY